jgi:hypothetical protein
LGVPRENLPGDGEKLVEHLVQGIPLLENDDVLKLVGFVRYGDKHVVGHELAPLESLWLFPAGQPLTGCCFAQMGRVCTIHVLEGVDATPIGLRVSHGEIGNPNFPG